MDTVVVNELKTEVATAILIYNAAGGGSAGMAAAQAYLATLLDTEIILPGITDPSLIDLVATTAPINYTTGVIG